MAMASVKAGPAPVDLFWASLGVGRAWRPGGIEPFNSALSGPIINGRHLGVCIINMTHGFVDLDSFWLSRVAHFQYNVPNPDRKAGATGYTRELLDKCSKA